ncbi:uncharacterized protein LOC131927646 [Physella acuta]|uniref:uncharacterized protein LOC131927646 n=1 Tax=Physella acuta TaxID=109671 RepID=UPI0027DAFBB8|nr:uncharacterized protein LOC131927646 [Physella acuta]
MYGRILILISVFASAKTDTGSAEAKKELVYFWGPNPLKHCSKNQLAFLRVFPDKNVQIHSVDHNLGNHSEALLEIRQKHISGTTHGFAEIPRIKDYENLQLEHPFNCVEMSIDSNISYNTARAVSPSYWRNNYTFINVSGIHTTEMESTGYSKVTGNLSLINTTANISACPRGTEKMEDTQFNIMLNEMLDDMFTFQLQDLLFYGFFCVLFSVHIYRTNNARRVVASRECRKG